MVWRFWFPFVLLLTIPIGGLVGQSKVFVGAKAGGHVSSAYISHTIQNVFIDTDLVTGYHAGAMVKIFTYRRINNPLNVGMQFGVDYSKNGWSQIFQTDEPKYRVRLSYVQIPMDAIVYLGRGKTKYFFTMGMFTEVLARVEKDPEPDLTNLGGADFYTFESSRDHRFGYGLRGTGGVQRTFGFGTVHLDGFFNFSISNALDPDSYSSGVPDISNQYVIGFSVAYLIPFGKLDFY